MNTAMHTVALFPIPDVVAFPGTVVPLHVFEPRYRTMINDCIDQQRMIAVCHTRKEIRAAKSTQTVQDALKSNQATYLPYDVFSAGLCEIVETTSDGRIYININMSKRLRFIEDVQTLPYRIARCSILEDAEDATENDEGLQTKIVDRIRHLIEKQNPALLSQFDTDFWINMPTDDFSFQVFQLLRFDAETMQSILESTSVTERLSIINDVINEEARP